MNRPSAFVNDKIDGLVTVKAAPPPPPPSAVACPNSSSGSTSSTHYCRVVGSSGCGGSESGLLPTTTCSTKKRDDDHDDENMIMKTPSPPSRRRGRRRRRSGQEDQHMYCQSQFSPPPLLLLHPLKRQRYDNSNANVVVGGGGGGGDRFFFGYDGIYDHKDESSLLSSKNRGKRSKALSSSSSRLNLPFLSFDDDVDDGAHDDNDGDSDETEKKKSQRCSISSRTSWDRASHASLPLSSMPVPKLSLPRRQPRHQPDWTRTDQSSTNILDGLEFLQHDFHRGLTLQHRQQQHLATLPLPSVSKNNCSSSNRSSQRTFELDDGHQAMSYDDVIKLCNQHAQSSSSSYVSKKLDFRTK